ncbi:YfiR family protein [Marinobacterium rhizophilum]|uniref:YfiR family protein n=1 Tax=Marinobacterium rhizophilum TaxID=420402 RepID=UPI0003711199|nr:YfiR family protein [Marinobacterium rhizophilum]
MKPPATLLVTLLLLGSCMITPATGLAREAANSATETRIKAAFLFKFCHYVTWPDSAFPASDSPINIGVIGSDDIARELQQAVAGRSIQQRPLHVRTYTAATLPDDIQLLYVGAAARAAAPRWLASLQGKPVLVVTDSRNGLDRGSSINFEVDGDRVRFDISLSAAQAHQLKLSSQLLSVARQVRGTPP